MSGTWERNRAVVGRRWPDVLAAIEGAPALAEVVVVDDTPARTLSVAGIQLTSAYDRVAEAAEQEALVPAGTADVWMYGIGPGDLARRLLTREDLRALNVVVLNPALTRAVLDTFEQSDWLADERVRFVLGRDETELRRPFAALPGELALAADECARLRDLVSVELAAPWVEETLARRDAVFAQAIADNEERIEGDGDVGELFGTRTGETVVVAGAGPSLAASLEGLRVRREALVAVDGALGPLLAAGVAPDTVVSIDAHEGGMARAFAGDLSALSSSSLVYYPVVPGEVLARWPGRRLVAYGAHARWADVRRRFPRAVLWVSGSVLHVAVDLALRMGAARVVLVGCDFALTGGRTHAVGSLLEQDAESVAGPAGPWVLGAGGERLPTLPNLVGYLRDLERYIAAHPEVTFFNASRGGAAIAGTRTTDEVGLGL